MKALVYTGPEAMAFQDAPEPSPAEGEALVEIEAVGVCGSDMHAFIGHDERRPPPLILGHEAAGVLTDGRRVTVNPLVTCGACEACRTGRANICATRQIISMPPRQGAFAERLAMPRANLVAVPEATPSEVACLAEPIACGWHAVRLGAAALHCPLGEAKCLVFGGGAIGLGAALVLSALGAKEIWLAEPNADRRAIVAKAGDFRPFDPTSEEGPGASAVDLVVDGVGIEASRASACAAVKPGGVIMHIGLGSAKGGVDVRRMTLHEISFIGTYTYTPDDFLQTAAAIFEGRLGKLDWPEQRPLSEGARAFADLRAGKVAAPKIILRP